MSACSLSSRVWRQLLAHPLTSTREQREKKVLSAAGAAIVAHFSAVSSIFPLDLCWGENPCHKPVIKVTRKERKPRSSSAGNDPGTGNLPSSLASVQSLPVCSTSRTLTSADEQHLERHPHFFWILIRTGTASLLFSSTGTERCLC